MTDQLSTTLRLVTKDDARIILDWQRNPVTRTYFHNPLPPSEKEHLTWMKKRLTDPSCILMLVLLNGAPVGVVRLDLIEPGVYEVSILINPDCYGQGIGKAALFELRKLKMGAEFRATVLSENLASKALFKSCGYRPNNEYYVSHPFIRAVFRADASAKIGAGHVMRSLTLAESLNEAGWGCAFACKAGTLTTVPSLGASGHKIIKLECDEQEEAIRLEENFDTKVNWLIVDHYNRDAAFETACRTWADQIMVIDDLADRPHDGDLLLDQGPDSDSSNYSRLVGKKCQFLMGPKYAMLRPQFSETRKTVCLSRQTGAVQRILVSLGSVDSRNNTAVVLKVLAKINFDFELDVVLGPNAPHLTDIHDLINNLSLEANIHIGFESMASLMEAADLAIGAAGTTSWERCCLGLPSIAIIVADNQSGFAEGLKTAGAARVLDGRYSISKKELEQSIQELAGSVPRRLAMAKAAYQMCDGLGAERVAQVVTEMTSKLN
jgi:UDP-2,4-diacetamido-2,4,6-trideoxy-beta-L-altropyranose hydrolase